MHALRFDATEPEHTEHGLKDGIGRLQLHSEPGVALSEVVRGALELRQSGLHDERLLLVVKSFDLLDQLVLPKRQLHHSKDILPLEEHDQEGHGLDVLLGEASVLERNEAQALLLVSLHRLRGHVALAGVSDSLHNGLCVD